MDIENTNRKETKDGLKSDRFFCEHITVDDDINIFKGRPILKHRKSASNLKQERSDMAGFHKSLKKRSSLKMVEFNCPTLFTNSDEFNRKSTDLFRKSSSLQEIDGTDQIVGNIEEQLRLTCEICKKNKENLINATICNECHQSSKAHFTKCMIVPFLVFLIALGIISYFLYTTTGNYKDLQERHLKLQNKYQTAIYRLNMQKAPLYGATMDKSYILLHKEQNLVAKANQEFKIMNYEKSIESYKEIIADLSTQRILYLRQIHNNGNMDMIRSKTNEEELNIYKLKIIEQNEYIKNDKLFLKSIKYNDKELQRKYVEVYYQLSNQISIYQRYLKQGRNIIQQPQILTKGLIQSPIKDEMNMSPLYAKQIKHKYDVLREEMNFKGDLHTQIILNLKNEIELQENSKKFLYTQVAFFYNELNKINYTTPEESEFETETESEAETEAEGPTTIKAFFSITAHRGFYYWDFNSYLKAFEGYILENKNGVERRSGVYSAEGIYLVAGGENRNVQFYNMTIKNPDIPQIQFLYALPQSEQRVNTCFLHGEHPICIDSSGYAKKYHFLTTQISEFFYRQGEIFISGTQTREGMVVLGNTKGKLYILDMAGKLLKEDIYESNWKVQEVIEVRRRILLTADGYSGCFLHNIRNLNTPQSVQILNSNHWYQTIIALQNNQGYFAVGGMRGITEKGFVDIYHLKDNDNHAVLIKSKGNIERDGCVIQSIREIRSKIIVFGGNYACETLCMWNYAAFPEIGPQCWKDQTIDGIFDFVPAFDF